MKIFLVLFGTISSFNMVSSQKIPRLQPIDCTIISEVQSKVHWHTTNVFSRLKGLSNITPLCYSTLWHQSKA